MTSQELHDLLADLRRRRTELDDVEAKSARQGSPQDVWKTICAFANRPGGGVILFGIDDVTYEVVGVGDPDRLQRDLAEAASGLEPPVRLSLSAHVVGTHLVIAAEIPEVEPSFRPCYRRSQGPYHGAYVRMGDGDRQMSEYEVYLAISSRVQPTEDVRPVEGASVADLDGGKVDALLADLRAKRPALAALGNDRQGLMSALNIVSREEPTRPTLAGLLALGRYPQTFFPSLVVTVTAFTSDEPDPAARLEGDIRCEGPIPEMLEQAMRAVQRFTRSRTIVRGIGHETVPEYPLAALREALVNAVAHRDYSRYAVGTQVQVRFFPNRIEIHNPGGLYGPVTVDLLGELGIQSTRNAALAWLLEDLGPMENRGTGLAAMAAAMRAAHLPPPLFQDGRTYFRVTLRNESLLTEDVLDWLAGFAASSLSDRQRYAMAYARRFGRITSREYRLLDPVDSRQAGRELKDLVEKSIFRQEGTRGGTYYVLTPTAGIASGIPQDLDENARQVLAVLAGLGEAGTSELARRTRLSRPTVGNALRSLMARGLVEPTTLAARAPNRRYRLKGTSRHETG